ncbi:MAG: hypothetical protein ACXWCX_27045, partial [Burkholderiales bacterium]
MTCVKIHVARICEDILTYPQISNSGLRLKAQPGAALGDHDERETESYLLSVSRHLLSAPW